MSTITFANLLAQPKLTFCLLWCLSYTCPNSNSDPPKYAFCFRDHPASYKGCPVYRDLQCGRKQTTKRNFLSDNIRNKTTNVKDSHSLTNSHSNQPPNHCPTYAQATSGESDKTPISTQDLNNSITNFLEELKSLINPLISLLDKVITKLLDKI